MNFQYGKSIYKPMPELAALFAMGFLANWIFAIAMIWRESRIESSMRMGQLQANLKKLNLRFANSQDAVVSRENEKPPSQTRTLMFLAIFCSALSWLGLIFSVIVVVSIEKLAHKERSVLFASDLSKGELEASQIRTLLLQVSESFQALDKAQKIG